MSFTEHVQNDIKTVFLNENEGAVTASLWRDGRKFADILVDFQEPYRLGGSGDGQVETTAPEAWASDEDIEGTRQGDQLEAGSTFYAIIGVEPAGDGMTRLVLSRNSE